MKHNLVRINDYLFVIGGNYKSNIFPYLVIEKLTTGEYTVWQVDNPNDWDEKNQYRILAHLPLNGTRYINDVPVLPARNQEDEAEEIFPVGKHGAMHMPNREMINNALRQQAYNKAKEKYKWTDEDVRNIIMHSFLKGVDRGHYSKEIENRIIQSFQQPKLPIAFEREMEPKFKKHIGSTKEVKGSGDRIKNKYAGNPKTFINSEGRTEWVGKYIYE